MNFIYIENVNKDKKDMPTIYINDTNVNFFELFDSIKDNQIINNELNKIIEFANKEGYDYINEHLWFVYQLLKKIEIPKIGRKSTRRFINCSDESTGVEINFVKNKRKNKIYYNNKYLKKYGNASLFESMSPEKGKKLELTIIREASFKNNIELLYIFLECLFQSSKTFYIIKCKYCEKYFVATKSDKVYCERKYKIKDSMVPCSNITSFIEKTNEYIKFRKEHNNFRARLISSADVSQDYIDKYDNAIKNTKKTCINNRDLNILNDYVKNYETTRPYKL